MTDPQATTPAAAGSLPGAEPLVSDIPGYEGLYQINRRGDVQSLERRVRIGNHTRKVGGHNLAQSLDIHGRSIVRLARNGKIKTMRVHVLVALVYLGPKPKDNHVHHKNRDITDNRDVNLEYLNGSDHHRLHKLGKPGNVWGVKHPRAKLNPEIVRDLRRRNNDGESFKALARELGVDPETVTRAVKGKTWGRV